MIETVPIGVQLGRLAGRQPDRVAITDHRQSLTWRELDRLSNRVARGLAQVGVGEGALVSVGLPNCADFVVVCYAIWKLGATPQPISFRLPQAESSAIMALAETPVLIAEPTMASDRPRYDVAALAALSDDDGALEPKVAPSFKAPTSGGSTGRPKLILSANPGVVNIGAPTAWGILADDIVVVPAPLFYNGPFLAAFVALNLGAKVVLLPKFDAVETLRAIERHRGTWLYMVPTMMSRIWKLPPEVRNGFDLSSLRAVWHMAAPCPAWLKHAWIDWLGPDRIMELYAGTEAQAVTAINGRDWLARPGSVGTVVGGEMKIVRPDGKELPAGEIGEIYMRAALGPGSTYRYLGADARGLGDGWESIGDIGHFDADGYLYLADRRTDLIIVGGANVYPAEVEAAIESHPLVESSVVIGLPDPEMGAEVRALVKALPGLSEQALCDHLRTRLAPYKLPRSIEFVAEALRDDGGKVRRSQLREARLTPAAIS